MKTLGDQAKDFRVSKGWSPAEMAQAVGTSRQNINSLEDHGNRIPKYIGTLAAVMGKRVDDMLAEAGLSGRAAPTIPAAQLPGFGDPSQTAGSVAEAVTVLADALLRLSDNERTTASAVLSQFGLAPDGKWKFWLMDLLAGNEEHERRTRPRRAADQPLVLSAEPGKEADKGKRA